MKIQVENFRSIKKETLELSPLTIMYGKNGSGKSSFLYALLTLKNIALNSNQSPDGFFNYQFMSIGGFDQVVNGHSVNNSIGLGVTLDTEPKISFKVELLSKNEGQFIYKIDGSELEFKLRVNFPYPLNQAVSQTIPIGNEKKEVVDIYWNGLTFNVRGNPPAGKQNEINGLLITLNSYLETIRKIQVVPVRRGFFKPFYSIVGTSNFLISEDEVATKLAQNKYLEYDVSRYLEEILEKELRVRGQIGTNLFSIDALERNGRSSAEIVNEGFGLNQLVYLLAKTLDNDAEVVVIEEPEVHLHPSACSRLAEALAEIALEKNKKILISTHSEAIVSSTLNLIATSKIKTSQVKLYWVKKERGATKAELQEANEKGQLKGGLTNFLEAELEILNRFIGQKQQ